MMLRRFRAGSAAALRKAGAHALWLRSDGVRIETVLDSEGVRAWSAGGAGGDPDR